MQTKQYQPKTGQKCSCKPGAYRDNCPQCEGTGWVIDFKAIRARTSETLLRNGLYPAAASERKPKGCVGFKWSGEKRNPRKGEWYLSGAIIEAYRATNDLSTPYHIATPII